MSDANAPIDSTDAHDITPADALTIPNLLTEARLVGVLGLLALAYTGHRGWFLALLAFLILTDWLDGKLARWLHQRSALGARLDSAADAAMYSALILSAWWLRPEFIRSDWPWLLAVGLSYGASTAAGLIKFGTIPSYHTRLAKVSWGLAAIGALSLFAGWSLWPARLAMAVVTVGNLEALAITLASTRWRADVSSLRHALRIRRQEPPQ